jgi:hypothetical protein
MLGLLVSKSIISSTTTTVVKSSPGVLRSIETVSGTPAQVTIYDNASVASGNILYNSIPSLAPTPTTIPATNGLVAVTSGSGPVLITYS